MSYFHWIQGDIGTPSWSLNAVLKDGESIFRSDIHTRPRLSVVKAIQDVIKAGDTIQFPGGTKRICTEDGVIPMEPIKNEVSN